MSTEHDITILMAVNKSVEDSEKAKELLDNQAKLIDFLNPKTVLVDSIKGYDDYSDFCMSRLAACFDTEFVLTIQFDGKIINPAAWSDAFFKYDYIGAPWHKYAWMSQFYTNTGKNPNNADLYVGNGGFSLRSKTLCEAVSEFSGLRGKKHEDSFICRYMRDQLEARGLKFAPHSVASAFSVENDVYSGQFGAHKKVFDSTGKEIYIRDLDSYPGFLG